MFEIYYILVIIMGACAGSFCHAMAMRLSSPVRFKKKYRSVCDTCERQLSPYEMIPIVSYLFLKGHCRTCFHKLPPSMLYTELGSSFFYLGMFLYPTLFSYKLLLLLVYHLLLIAMITDRSFMIIPNRLLLFLFFLSILLMPWLIPLSIPLRLLGLSIGLGLPLFIMAITRGGLGGGDVKLFMLLGWLLGLTHLLRLMILSCACGIIGFLFLPLFLKTNRPRLLPFAPFIFMGFLLEVIWDFWRSTGFFLFR